MTIKRRDLLKLGLVSTLSSKTLGQPIEGAKVERRNGPSILQGATDHSRIQFSIVHRRGMSLNCKVIDDKNQSVLLDDLRTISFPGQSHIVTKVFVSRLSVDRLYHLVVFDGSKEIDRREFKTLDQTKATLRFALASCMDDHRHKPEIWQQMVAEQPDVIFFIGDSVYCDYGDAEPYNEIPPKRIWRRFTEARRTLEIFYSKRLVPIIATWDDHDFGLNDTGKSFPYAKESLQNFLSFYAQDTSHCQLLSRGPGLSHALTYGDHQFVLLDDRTWREDKASQDRYAHWGQSQEEWLMSRMASHGGLNWLLNGTQFFPEMIFKESVSGDHPVQFEALLSQIKQGHHRVVFASGDVHFSEVSEIDRDVLGYQTYELTSSSIHSYKYPGLPEIISNERRIASTGEHNFLLIETGTRLDKADVEFTVRSVSSGGKTNFDLRLRTEEPPLS